MLMSVSVSDIEYEGAGAIDTGHLCLLDSQPQPRDMT
jgi:hypothetical protein